MSSPQPDNPQIADLIRRRGLVSGRWIGWPFFVMTAAACAIAAWFQAKQRPDFVMYTAGLYLCMAWFANLYRSSWRAGAHVRRLLSMIITLAILTALCWLHIDDATPRTIYVDSVAVQRPPRQELFVSVALNALAGLALLTHGLALGFGSRVLVRDTGRRITEQAVRAIIRDDAALDDDPLNPVATEGEPLGSTQSPADERAEGAG